VPDVDEPGDVTQQVHVPGIADAQTGPHALPMQLLLVDHFAQRRGVQ
jgi:hypothetical protein